MFRVQYTPSPRIEVILNRWFWTEAAARRFASYWQISVVLGPDGRKLEGQS